MIALSFREGDFVETSEGLIFDVKGLIHPLSRVIAFVRYIPSLDGDRERGGIRYRRMYDLGERFSFLKREFPQYLVYDPIIGEEMIEVPVERVTHHYQPISKLAELRSLSNLCSIEKKSVKLTDYVINLARIDHNNIGVSGSVLVGLTSPSSDLDLVVYGVKNALKVDAALKKSLDEGEHLKRFGLEALKRLHKDRCCESGVSLKDYVFHEERKSFQGLFDGIEFFVRYVKDWSEYEEVYGESIYAPMGWAEVRCVVVDNSDALFTPCFYGVEEVEVVDGTPAKPIVGATSFRGRFCQHAFVGERIAARGKLERVTRCGEIYHRLVLGGSPKDFMVVIR